MRRTLLVLALVTLLAAFAAGCCSMPRCGGWHGAEHTTAWNLDACETPCCEE
jgi:hypothetical protein